MADVAAAPVETHRKPGRPLKHVPVPGEAMTSAMKDALRSREHMKKLYAENRVAILEQRKATYHARVAKAKQEAAELEMLRDLREVLLRMTATQ